MRLNKLLMWPFGLERGADRQLDNEPGRLGPFEIFLTVWQLRVYPFRLLVTMAIATSAWQQGYDPFLHNSETDFITPSTVDSTTDKEPEENSRYERGSL